MSADVTIGVAAVEPVPLDYTIPGAAELLLKVLSGSFDGSGAGGSWVPAIQLIVGGTQIVATFPLGQALAAGASADVSWFPRGGVSAKAAALGLSYAVTGTNTTSVPTGVQTGFDFVIGPVSGEIQTNDPTTFTIDVSTDPDVLGLHGLGIHTPGVYIGFYVVVAQDTAGHLIVDPWQYWIDPIDFGNTTPLGANAAVGDQITPGAYQAIGGTESTWAASWTQPYQIDDTGTEPIVLAVTQDTGDTLQATASIAVVKVA